MILVGLLVFYGLLNATDDIYNKFDVSRKVPLRGYIQVLSGLESGERVVTVGAFQLKSKLREETSTIHVH